MTIAEPRGSGAAEDYWRRAACRSRQNEKAARADAEMWRARAADLEKQVEYLKEPVFYRFRGRRDGLVWDRDVMKIPIEDLDDILEERPYIKKWTKFLDGDLVLMISPEDATAPLSGEAVWDMDAEST